MKILLFGIIFICVIAIVANLYVKNKIGDWLE